MKRSYSRVRCCLPLSLILIAYLTVGTTAAAETRPNVVIVITDDQGYGDLSCHGNPVLKTPNLDTLYGESLRLTDYHVSPTCSPTRSALLTGHWTNRTGAWHTIMGRSLLRENETTLGDFFAEAGYATGMFGKWHLGDNFPFRPEDRGFHEVLRHGGGGVGQTPDFWDNAYFDGSYWHNGQVEPVKGYCTDVFFEAAQTFIRKQHTEGRPFLAYIATNAPHGPMHAPVADSKPYEDRGTFVANFFGMIANIDTNVGRLRAFLESEGIADNTLFIFTTDNGTAAGHKLYNAGMRGQKGSEYDGGHRVPCFLYWPHGNLTGGRDIRQLTAHVDIVPTLLDICGINATSNPPFDGRSIKPLLMGEANAWPERIIVTDSQRVRDPIKWRKSAVMTSRWRLINGKELYDMSSDPGQAFDVAADHGDIVRELTAFYEAWWSELYPTFAVDADIYLGHPAENPACLTAHDWITRGSTPWNQASIRKAVHSPNSTGHWNVHVANAGQYEIRLRRWPKETGLAINAPLAPGAPVPGSRPFRAAPGIAIHPTKATIRFAKKNGEVVATSEAAVPVDAEEVVIMMELETGHHQFEAQFHSDDGTVHGAYYAYVHYIDN